MTEGGKSFVGTIFFFLIGPIVWAVHLAVIYSGQSLLCAKGFGAAALLGVAAPTFLVAAVTAAAAASIAAPLLAPANFAALFRASGWPADDQHFIGYAMRLLAILSLTGVLWGGVATLFLSPCASPA